MSPKAWLPLLTFLLVIGSMFHSKPWVAVPVLLIIIMLAANWWRNHALDQVTYRRRWHYRRAFPGETSTLRIDVENHKLLPVSWLRVTDPWPDAVAPLEEEALAPSHIPEQHLLTHLYSLRWFDRVQRDYTIQFKQRGVYTVGPARLSSGDLFGMYSQARELDNQEYLTVFPELTTLAALNLKAEDPFGDRKSRRRIFEDPSRPIGIREYHPEDSFRMVHWPATARTGELQVKVYQPVSSQVMTVCLNVATLPHYWEGILPGLLEQLVKVAATLAYEGMHSGYAVGLVSNGTLAHSDTPFRVKPGRSPQQLARLLETLAGVTPFTSIPFEQLLLRSMPEVPYGATLIIITAFISPELVNTLARLRRYRPHMMLISLAQETPPEMQGVQVVHLPYSD